MLRSLIHYRRVNIAVLIGAATTTAVLVGALIVGDSVRGSLASLVRSRLGAIDDALVAGRFVREALVAEIGTSPLVAQSAPAIVVRGSAISPSTGRRASRVGILGVDQRFLGFFSDGAAVDLSPVRGTLFAPAVISEPLAREMGLRPGDELLLSFERASDVPRETLLGERDPDEVLTALRVTVAAIVDDRGVGGFALEAGQRERSNLFVALPRLARALDREGQVNLVVARRQTLTADLQGELVGRVSIEDLGLVVGRGPGYLQFASRSLVISPRIERAVSDAAQECGLSIIRTQLYVANAIRAGDKLVPYAMVLAQDSDGDLRGARLVTRAGGTPAPIRAHEALLGEWAAHDLGVGRGDEVSFDYWRFDEFGELIEESRSFVVADIVSESGLAADATLAPDYPGIRDADDLAGWKPPFPVDLGRIRPRDEDHWDRLGPAPQAFVRLETGRKLWGSSHGDLTAIRVASRDERPLDEVESAMRRAIASRLQAADVGLRFEPVRARGLAAAVGSTDFTGLFLGFSFFLIVSAVLLSALLFRLGIERRSREIGLLLAIGWPVRRVRWRLLGEGVAVATAGACVGLVGAVAWGQLLISALTTRWRPAVNSSHLELHVLPQTLALGSVVAVLVVALAILVTVRRLVRRPPIELLAEAPAAIRASTGAGRWRLLAAGAMVIAFGLLGTGLLKVRELSPAVALGGGAFLLVAGLAAFAARLRRAVFSPFRPGPSGLVRMALRNCAWNPGRSMLAVSLVASATFVIVAVAASRGAGTEDLTGRNSGSGGFSLVAQTAVGVPRDLSEDAGRAALGFTPEESHALDQATLLSLRSRPGEDTSCQNLYRPEAPKLLGVSAALARRGGFRFASFLEPPDEPANPWAWFLAPPVDGIVPAMADANSAQWILHRSLGEVFEIDDEFGEPLQIRLVALFAGSVFQSELLLPERVLLERFPGQQGVRVFLIETPAADVGRIADLLESRLSAWGFDATRVADRLREWRQVEETYLRTFALLGGLGLMLGVIGLGVIVLRNVLERRTELAALRAFGFPRWRVTSLVLLENAAILILGIGLGAASAIAAVAPRLATIEADWVGLAGTLGAVGLAGCLATLAALRSAFSANLIDALKSER